MLPSIFRRQVAQPSVRISIIERKGKRRLVANLIGYLAKQLQGSRPYRHIIIDSQKSDRQLNHLNPVPGFRGIAGKVGRPVESFLSRTLNRQRPCKQPDRIRRRDYVPVCVQDPLPYQHPKLIQVARCRIRIDTVNRCHISCRTVNENKWHSNLLFDIFGNVSLNITADLDKLPAQYCPVNSIVGYEHEGTSIVLVNSDETYPAVHRAIRVQSYRCPSIYVYRASVDVRLRKTPANAHSCRT